MSCSRRCAEDMRTREPFFDGVTSDVSLTCSWCQGDLSTRCLVSTRSWSPSGRGARRSALRGDALGARPAYVVHPAELLEQPDGPGGDVDLPTEHAVPRARRIRVVQVVPALTERQNGQRPEVGCFVALADLERALADHVTDRVDRPRDVVQERHAYESGPEQRPQRAGPRPRDEATDRC